jgi:type IV pilus assembly protein PilA
MKKIQKGFTLIELMIVVAIVGILAAVALPAYQDYIKRSKVSEPAAALGACKTSYAEFVAARNAYPANVNELGCNTTATRYSTAITLNSDTEFRTALSNIGDAGVDGTFLSLQPTSDTAQATLITSPQVPIASWRCSTTAAANLYKLFPAECRRAAAS